MNQHCHLGEKRYEIKDHLGNVRAVTSDIKNAGNYSLSASSWKFLADIRSLNNINIKLLIIFRLLIILEDKVQNINENSKILVDKLTYKELVSLKDIVEKKIIEYKREQILIDAIDSINDYKLNKLKALEYSELIEELNS